MDISGSDPPAPAKEGSEDSKLSELTTSRSLVPMQFPNFPEDILHMIFTEFMCKPPIHFANITVKISNHVFEVTSMTPWTEAHISSGYIATQVLSQTCQISRQVLKHALIEPSLIHFDNGSVQVDAATDLTCFVLPPCCEDFDWWVEFESYDVDTVWLYKDIKSDIARNFGNVRRAGILVTRDMWDNVLAHWFITGPDSYEDIKDQIYGGLDVTTEDWDEYFSKFPVLFYDYTGPYVDVSYDPIHRRVIDRLWASRNNVSFFGDDAEYLGPTKEKEIQQILLRHLHSQMDSHLRVGLLLGQLEVAQEHAQFYQPSMHRVKIGILARKPDFNPDNSASKRPRDPESTPSDIDLSTTVLDRDEKKARWLKEKLDGIISDSQAEYDKDRVAGDEVGDEVSN